MAILGLGTDIVEIARIEAVIARSGDRLARRVLSDHEWSIWEQHQQPVRFLAKRFAVKEAAAKALGTGIRNGLAFNQFEVYNDELGKPKLRLWGEANLLAERMGVSAIHVTLADERHYACATVIVESYPGGRLNFIRVVHQHEFIPQLFFTLDVCRIFQDRIRDRAHFLAGWRVVMTHALGAAVAVNLINALTHRNGLIRALRLAHIAVDAFFGN